MSEERENRWDRIVRDVEEQDEGGGQKNLVGWLDSEFVEVEYIRPQVSGSREINYLQHFVGRNLERTKKYDFLSIACGGGNLERAICYLGAAKSIEAFDSSEGSISLAAEMAAKEGLGEIISYRVGDANTLELKEEAYDVAFAKMALHHIADLDHVFSQMRRSLRPGGLLMVNDYIGPSRYQWTEEQLRLMNEALRLLPEKVRWRGKLLPLLDRIDRPSVKEMTELDPTEAVRSAEIVERLGSWFDIREFKGYGGSILHILLNHTLRSFDLEDEDQRSILRSLFLLEREMIGRGVLQHDFAYIVAEPKKDLF